VGNEFKKSTAIAIINNHPPAHIFEMNEMETMNFLEVTLSVVYRCMFPNVGIHIGCQKSW